MVCDDDRQVRAAVRMVAEQRGHEIIGECATSLEAIELLRGRRADAAIVDLALSGGTGHEVLVAAAELGLPVIVFSAFVNDVNPAAYTNPPIATTIGQSDYSPLGGSPSNFRGPGFHRFDFSLFKHTPVTEKIMSEFRVEIFNIFNFNNFANPSVNPTSSTFGLITNTRNGASAPGIGYGEPFNIQFAAKLSF